MKNKIKILITIFTTAVVCISGTIYAASIISAKDISFTSTKEGWNPTNVEEAINDLYGKSENINQGESLCYPEYKCILKYATSQVKTSANTISTVANHVYLVTYIRTSSTDENNIVSGGIVINSAETFRKDKNTFRTYLVKATGSSIVFTGTNNPLTYYDFGITDDLDSNSLEFMESPNNSLSLIKGKHYLITLYNMNESSVIFNNMKIINKMQTIGTSSYITVKTYYVEALDNNGSISNYSNSVVYAKVN